MKVDVGIIVTAVNNAASGLQGVKKDLEGIAGEARNTEERLRAIQVVIAGIAIEKGRELAKSFIETTASLEKLQTQLAITLGPDAQKRVDEMREKFGATGLDVEQVVQAFARFQQVGMPVEQAEKLTNALAEMVLIGAKTPDAFQSASIAFARMFAKGEADARSLSRTLETAVPLALDVMVSGSQGKFKTIADLIDATQRGAVSAEEAIAMAVEGASKRTAGSVRVFKDTVGGAFEGLKESWLEAVNAISKNTPVNQELVTRLQSITHEIEHFASNITVQNVKDFFDVLDKMASAAYNLAKALAPVVKLLAEFGSMAAAAIAAVPPEIALAGLIGYIFYGRTGAAVAAAVAAVYQQVRTEVEGKTNSFISFVEDALPFGLIGLIVGGKKIALLLTFAAAGIDAATTGLAYLISKATGDQKTIDYIDKGGTAFKKLGGALKDVTKDWGSFDDAQKKATGDHGPGGDRFSNFDKLVPLVDASKFSEAKRAQQDFIEQLNRMDSGFRTSGTNMTAYSAVLQHLEKGSDDAKGSISALANTAQNLDSAVVANKTSLNAQQAAIREVAKSYQDGKSATGDYADTLGQVNKRQTEAAQFTGQLNAAFEKLNQLTAENAGDTLEQKSARINATYEGLNKTLGELYPKLKTFFDIQRNQTDFPDLYKKYQDIAQKLGEGNEQRQVALSKEQSLDSILQNELVTQQKLAQSRADLQALQLKQTYSNDNMFNLGAGTPGGQIVLQVQRERLQLNQQILQSELEINRLEKEKLNTNNPELIAQIDTTIQKYQQLGSTAKSALQGLSADAVATKQLWNDVGGVLHNSVADGISGIISRTMTWQQVQTNVFNALTKAAVNYIMKLAEIQLFGNALGGSGGGTGGGIFGGLFGKLFGGGSTAAAVPAAANGGVFPGGVRMFANGGIIGGPTLFGMAGEAGTEAIMPLTSVNGKLGVSVAGSASGDMHIHIHAIDTQNGVEFLMKHMDSIQGALSMRGRLNQGNRQYP